MWQKCLGCLVFVGLVIQGELLRYLIPFTLPLSEGILAVAEDRAMLQPLLFYSCPNESATFTCTGNNITHLEWKVEPYTDPDVDLSYIPLRLNEMEPQTRSNSDHTLYSELINFSRISDRLAIMTTSLQVKTSGMRNETNITCLTLLGSEVFAKDATIYFASILKVMFCNLLVVSFVNRFALS